MLNRKLHQLEEMENQLRNTDGDDDDEDDELKTDDRFLLNLRRVVGGLLIPSIAISLDKIVLHRLNLSKSPLVRTAFAMFGFLGVKSALKLFLLQKKLTQESKRDILDYVKAEK